MHQDYIVLFYSLTFLFPGSPGVFSDSWSHPPRTCRVRLPDAHALPARFWESFGPGHECGRAHPGDAAGGFTQRGGQHGPSPRPCSQAAFSSGL